MFASPGNISVSGDFRNYAVCRRWQPCDGDSCTV